MRYNLVFAFSSYFVLYPLASSNVVDLIILNMYLSRYVTHLFILEYNEYSVCRHFNNTSDYWLLLPFCRGFVCLKVHFNLAAEL